MTASERYQRAVLLLDEYHNAARNGERLLRQAREHLEGAIELRPAHAKSQALLGYTFDALGRAQQAEIKAVARRQKVDIAAIDRGFKEAGWQRPKAADYLRNGFVHARNSLESSIADEAARLRNELEPDCQQAKLVRELDALSDEIHAWLDSFPEGKMTAEAAAFMYLALGVEEIR